MHCESWLVAQQAAQRSMAQRSTARHGRGTTAGTGQALSVLVTGAGLVELDVEDVE
jgi:hypothetical protein